MKGFLAALSFLTIFPFGRGKALDGRQMAASMAWFPLVGLWLGAVIWLVDIGLRGILPVAVTSVLLIALLAFLTGGLHLDGFADTLDGLYFGHTDREKILAIMKDSRIGAMGVIGLVLLLLMKFVALNNIAPSYRGQALLIMPTLARWSQVRLAVGAEYARKQGSLAQPFVEFLKWRHFIFATILAVAAAIFLSGIPGLVCLGVVLVSTMLWRLYLNRRIGGITGDTIGAVSEINEVLVLLVYSAATSFVKVTV